MRRGRRLLLHADVLLAPPPVLDPDLVLHGRQLQLPLLLLQGLQLQRLPLLCPLLFLHLQLELVRVRLPLLDHPVPVLLPPVHVLQRPQVVHLHAAWPGSVRGAASLRRAAVGGVRTNRPQRRPRPPAAGRPSARPAAASSKGNFPHIPKPTAPWTRETQRARPAVQSPGGTTTRKRSRPPPQSLGAAARRDDEDPAGPEPACRLALRASHPLRPLPAWRAVQLEHGAPPGRTVGPPAAAVRGRHLRRGAVAD